MFAVDVLTCAHCGGTLGSCDGAYALHFLAFVASDPTTLGAPFVSGDIVHALV